VKSVVNPSGSALPKAICKDCGGLEAVTIDNRVICAKCKCGTWVIKHEEN